MITTAIKTAILAIWKHFTGMTSGVNGQPSINRNMAWGITSLLLFVEMYSLIVFPRTSDSQLKMFCTQCIVYVVADISFVLLVLKITSVEKLTEQAQKVAGIIRGYQPEQPAKATVTTQVETTIQNNQP